MEEIFMLRPKEVVCKWVDAFNNHDVEAIVSYTMITQPTIK